MEDPKEEEAIVEFTTTSEYITNASNVLYAVNEWDPITKADISRKKRMSKQCIAIMELCLKEMYDELFEKEVEED